MFENYETYDGDDLGASYLGEDTGFHTRFRLWAPSAGRVELCLYREGDGDCLIEKVNMKREQGGTWYVELDGDRTGTYYTYQVTTEQGTRESGDPYARAAGVNGGRSMVVDLPGTNPEGFDRDGLRWYEKDGVTGSVNGAPIPEGAKPVRMDLPHAVVTEISVRDMTADPRSGVSEAGRGRFCGLTEDVMSTEKIPGGLAYLKSLGVTHVQIMPFYDFGSIDESKPIGQQYNWGYDPVNYNVPEGSYATDAFCGEVRIRECKEMIQAFHNAGIGVIMDVVYNHTFDIENSVFQKCVPDYFYRKKGKNYSNGSGCGNELASERRMVRKYILDSVRYWSTEYHIDGFRFDLMGVLDLETMRQIHRELSDINPDILIYGEGWTGGDSVLSWRKRALKCNARRIPGVGMFSDDIRDAIKGHVFYDEEKGFVNGVPENSEKLMAAAAGAVRHPQTRLEGSTAESVWAQAPNQTVNYVSCHDNLTLWDKLAITCEGKPADGSTGEGRGNPQERILAANRLAAAIVFTAQGMPFFLCGEESARTKTDGRGGFSGNSYDLPVEVNRLDYGRMAEYQELADHYRGLIAFRKAHPSLWFTTAEETCANLHFVDCETGWLSFEIKGQEETAFVAYNATEKARVLKLPPGSWGICVDKTHAMASPFSVVQGQIPVDAGSCLVCLSVRC